MINTAHVGQFLREARQDMKSSQIFALLGMLGITLAVSITFCVYLGIYSLNNPDKPAWIGLIAESNERAMFKTHAEVDTAKAIQVVDIHSRFIAWFFWGFLNWFAPIFIIVSAIITCSISQVFGLICTGILAILTACSAVAWFIVGAIWRFNLDGQYASGSLIPEGKTEDEWFKVISAEGSPY